MAASRGAQAQIDYRNLDDDRPTHVEDAYPLERYAFELITPYRVVRARGGHAPLFTARHPRAAAIFDNLHMMHDIISDVLAADTVPRDRKREVIYSALAEFQNPNQSVMSREQWLMMGDMMGGIEAMGGPATGLLPRRQPPAAAPVHRHDD